MTGVMGMVWICLMGSSLVLGGRAGVPCKVKVIDKCAWWWFLIPSLIPEVTFVVVFVCMAWENRLYRDVDDEASVYDDGCK
jgi:hypothetical protein